MASASLRLFVLVFAFLLEQIFSNELTFELPDNAKECFNEKMKVGSKYVLEFQVSRVLEERERERGRVNERSSFAVIDRW